MKTKLFSGFIFMLGALHFVACNNDSKVNGQTGTQIAAAEKTSMPAPVQTVAQSNVDDGPAIATMETNDFVLKIHRAISFELKPKSYQPIKVDPSTKLVVLDVSVHNKLSTPINFSRILGMTVIKGDGDKNLMAPWVVGAYEVDYAEANHQKEYDALWSSQFEPNGFHRAVLIGLNPKKDENNFTMIVPGKPDFNSPEKKEIKFNL
ncbi:MAG TPA: hypothetical protein VNT20_10195 [Flavisolibacter sp.]|jgi:hypothetical protein|nr:hypothetical protein [Flavisolibacter sp.]